MNVWVHHGSVLSYLLFIIVLEVLSRVLHSGAPWPGMISMRSSCHHYGITGGTCQEAHDID